MYISDIYNNRPSDKRSELEEKFYDELERLNISFDRVDNDVVESMDQCVDISNVLGSEIRKTVLVCNRQKTNYYMVILPAEKRFDTKLFSTNMECSRVSFASGEDMNDILGVLPGSASIASILNDKDNKVLVVIDKEIMDDEYFSCNPGANTSHIKISTDDLKLFLDNNHEYKIIEL